jgi:hypothetical protein
VHHLIASNHTSLFRAGFASIWSPVDAVIPCRGSDPTITVQSIQRAVSANTLPLVHSLRRLFDPLLAETTSVKVRRRLLSTFTPLALRSPPIIASDEVPGRPNIRALSERRPRTGGGTRKNSRICAGWRTAPDRVPASGQAFALIEREVERSGEVESKVINRLVLRVSAIDEVKMLDHEDDVGQNRRPKPC